MQYLAIFLLTRNLYDNSHLMLTCAVNARPLGRGMGCHLWIQLVIDILPQFLQLFIQYFTVLDHVIMAPDCNSHLHWFSANSHAKIDKIFRDACNSHLQFSPDNFHLIIILQFSSNYHLKNYHAVITWQFSTNLSPKMLSQFSLVMLKQFSLTIDEIDKCGCS